MLLRLFGRATVPVHRLLGGRRFDFEAAGMTVPVWEFGPADGEPWLLLHGLASSALAWRPIVQELPGCRLLVPELSPWAGGPPALTLAQGVALATGLIERRLGGGPATVAGMSLGGWIAVRLALARPELVSRLLLVDAAGWRDQDWERIERLVRVETRRDLSALYDAIFSRVPWSLQVVREGFYHAYRSQGVASTLDSVTESQVYGPAEMARLAVPVGVVWGVDDGLFTTRVARETAQHARQGRLWLLPDCGHNPHWEAPGRFRRVVREFRDWAKIPPWPDPTSSSV